MYFSPAKTVCLSHSAHFADFTILCCSWFVFSKWYDLVQQSWTVCLSHSAHFADFTILCCSRFVFSKWYTLVQQSWTVCLSHSAHFADFTIQCCSRFVFSKWYALVQQTELYVCHIQHILLILQSYAVVDLCLVNDML